MLCGVDRALGGGEGADRSQIGEDDESSSHRVGSGQASLLMANS